MGITLCLPALLLQLTSIFQIHKIFKDYHCIEGPDTCRLLLESQNCRLIYPPSTLKVIRQHFRERHNVHVRFQSEAPGVAIYKITVLAGQEERSQGTGNSEPITSLRTSIAEDAPAAARPPAANS